MRYSQYFIPTVKETPADAEVISHQLMLRAGMIRKLAAGIYNYLPLGLRSIRKVENIVREEMNRAGAIEILMPGVIPAELWKESGRWEQYGKELLRYQGPQGRRILPRTDPRGGGDRPGPPRDQELPPDADQPLPDPDQVPRRDPPPLRPDARPRVHHEGRLLLRRGRGGCRPLLREDVPGLPPHLRALRPQVPRRGGGHRHHRRHLLPRVHGAGRLRRGCHRLLLRLRVRRQRGKGRVPSSARRWSTPTRVRWSGSRPRTKDHRRGLGIPRRSRRVHA